MHLEGVHWQKFFTFFQQNTIHYINISLACFHVNRGNIDDTSAGASHRFGVISSDAALNFCN